MLCPLPVQQQQEQEHRECLDLSASRQIFRNSMTMRTFMGSSRLLPVLRPEAASQTRWMHSLGKKPLIKFPK